MEKLDRLVSPGTAGLTQRIPSKYEVKNKEDKLDLYIVKYNKVMPCGHNQY